MRILILSVALLALGGATASAQQAPPLPVSVDILVLPAEGDPITVAPVVPPRNTVIGQQNADGTVTPNANCDHPPVTPASTATNPTWAYFDDPFHPGRTCRAPFGLAGVPEGAGYRGVAVFIATSCRPVATEPLVMPCPSARSAVGVPPFAVASVIPWPVAPTRLVIVP